MLVIFYHYPAYRKQTNRFTGTVKYKDAGTDFLSLSLAQTNILDRPIEVTSIGGDKEIEHFLRSTDDRYLPVSVSFEVTYGHDLGFMRHVVEKGNYRHGKNWIHDFEHHWQFYDLTQNINMDIHVVSNNELQGFVQSEKMIDGLKKTYITVDAMLTKRLIQHWK